MLNIFLFGFVKTLVSKGILNTIKRRITSAMECADLASFTLATKQVLSCLLCKSILPEVLVINYFENLRAFFVELSNSCELFLGFFIEMRFKGKILSIF